MVLCELLSYEVNQAEKELKRLKEELSEAEYKEFKGVLWLLRKNPAQLTPEELEVIKSQQFPVKIL